MTQPRRRPVGRGYSQEFDLLQAATSSLDTSRTLEAAWNGDGGGRGGEHLDDLLTDLGEAYIEDGRVKWDPPPRLDPTYVDYLSQSVEDLNSRLRSGNLTIDEDGNIRPHGGTGGRERSAEMSRHWRR